jgi:exodeoxyribonuclease VII large subunit
LRIAFEQLRDRLQAEGLFAKTLKRPLPVFPRRVGVVTSPSGAAVRDILNVISRRTQTVNVLLSPARVQGDGAGPDIARAIRLINQYHERAVREGRPNDFVDVLIVGRGGGSTEDLWAFNTEEVARAIRNSAIPVISAVGHETDFTIADFVADHRAPTPSAAAEIVAAREDQLCTALEQLGKQLVRLIRFKIMDARTRVQEHALSQVFDEVKAQLSDVRLRSNSAGHQLHAAMSHRLKRASSRTNSLVQKITPAQLQSHAINARARYEVAANAILAAVTARMNERRERLGLAVASLDALSPLGVLSRGYAIAQDADGRLLRDVESVKVGDQVNVRLERGRLETRVEGVKKE